MNDFLKPRDGLSSAGRYLSPQIDANVRLNANESPLTPLVEPSIIEQLELNRYPDREARTLRDAIASQYKLSANQVFAANGSNEVIQTFLLTYGGPKRSVMIFSPTYVMHSKIAAITGTSVIDLKREKDFSLNTDFVCEHIEKEKPELIFLCSPNNPTGASDSEELPERILKLLETYSGILFIDEAYGEFASSSFVSLVSEKRPLVISRTFSKAWGLAGLRLGYLLGPSWCIKEIENISLPYHLGAITQSVAVNAMKNLASVENQADDIIRERDRISEALKNLAVEVWPSETNFILFRPTNMDAAEVWEGLVSKSVLIRDFSKIEGLEGCLRVTVGTETENNVFIEALEEILR